MDRPRRLISVRLDRDVVARLDLLAERLRLPGGRRERSTAIRAALLAGIDTLEAGQKNRQATPKLLLSLGTQ